MIRTSCHKNWNSNIYKTYSISGNRGKDVGYKGKCYPALALPKNIWKTWHDNIGYISEEENNRYYVEQYYLQVLAKLNPEKLYGELNHSVLLCYEDNEEFCHRHIVAEWLQILLNVKVPEIKIDEEGIVEVERPEYIKTYLEDAMRKYNNMRGFNSLRAWYLFELGETIEKEAMKLERDTGKSYDHYKEAASHLRNDAFEEEIKFKSMKLLKVKKSFFN